MKATLHHLLLVCFFPCLLQAQSSFDTAHIYTCAKFWKTGQLISDCQLIAPPVLSATPNADKSCWAIQYLPAAVDTNAQNCYYLTKSIGGDPLNGVTIADIIRISEHILGLNPLSGAAFRAADINRTNTITAFDLIELRKLILGIYTDFPNNNSWNIYTDPNNLFNCNQLQQNPAVQFDTTSFDFVKTGDVDGDANPAGFYQAPANAPHALRMPDWTLSPLVEVWVPLYFTSPVDIKGLQLGLTFQANQVELLKMRTASGVEVSPSSYGLFSNQITLAMSKYADDIPALLNENTPVVEILVRPLQSGHVSQVFQINHQVTVGLTVDQSGNIHPIDSTLAFTTTQTNAPDNIRIFGQPTPNPFHEKTSISVEFEQEETVLIELFGIDGKLISAQTSTIPGGKSQIEFNRETLQQRSVAVYRITGEGWSSSGKLIRQ